MLRGLIFLMAILAAGGAAWMSLSSSGAVSASDGSQDTVVSSMTQILVAAVDLPAGALADTTSFRWQSWPMDTVNASFITHDLRPDAGAAFAGQIVRAGLIAGEPIYDAKFAAGDAGALAVILASGKQAVAVRVSAENSAGGFVLPNDRVDVLLTTNRPDAVGMNRFTSKVILKNVKVLAVDQMTDGSSDAVVGKTATLELKPAEVEIVTAAEASGALSLALRAMADNGDVAELLVTEKRTIRIIRGGQLEIVELD